MVHVANSFFDLVQLDKAFRLYMQTLISSSLRSKGTKYYQACLWAAGTCMWSPHHQGLCCCVVLCLVLGMHPTLQGTCASKPLNMPPVF